MTQTEKNRHTGCLYALVVVLLLAFTAVRWSFLRTMPVFIDETIGINWARDALQGNVFLGLHHARWLDSVIHALFKPLGPESLWLTRAVTGLLSMLTYASVIGLARLVDSRRAGLLAGAIYLLLPYTIFFDRQVLGDPVAAAFAGVMLVASLKLARKPAPYLVPVIGVTLAASILSKFSSVFYAPAPLLAALIAGRRADRRRVFWLAAASTALAGLIVLGVLVVADRYLAGYQSILSPSYDWNWSRVEGGLSFADRVETWRQVFGVELAGTVDFFLGWPLVGGVVVALVMLLTGAGKPPHAERRELIWLWLAGIGLFLPFLVIASWLPSRYLAIVTIGLVSVTAVGLARLLHLLADIRLPQPWARITGGALAAGLVLWPVGRDVTLLTHPEQTTIPVQENRDYFGDQSFIGLEDVAQDLRMIQAESPGAVHVVYSDEIFYMALASYWGGAGGILRAWEGSADQQAEVARWLLAGENVVYLDDGQAIPVNPHGTVTELVGTYPGQVVPQYRLRRVTGVTAEMQTAMFNQAFGNPYGVADDYRALAGDLQAGQAVLLYPPHQVDVLSEALAGKAVDLIPLGESWPLDLEEVKEAVEQAAPFDGVLTWVTFNETAGDPDDEIESWLHDRYFRVEEYWVGALRVLTYLPAAGVESQSTTLLIFEEGVTLVGLSTGQQAVGGQHYALFDLTWETAEPVEESYKVAVHIIDETGEIIAQHDGIPGGYLRPTTGWEPGSPVTDRFAIRLPEGLADGTYAVRLLLYDEVSGARLRVTNIKGMPEWVIVDEITLGS